LHDDPSNGWEAVAHQLIERRDQSRIGVNVVRNWARTLNPGASILDLGCGSGIPISQALMDAGFIVTGVDASPTLAATFRRRFPDTEIACEQAETSQFLGRTYDAAIAVGLLFLLGKAAQKVLISKVGSALKVGGRFLFTAPSQSCTWNDMLTGRQSLSLGAAAYLTMLSQSGLTVVDEYTDEGQNHYYDAVR
jgi:2-polyprenyl-3-methyl-5-hydroxy-6-metoxy-1,4-benzoquinol methylase